MQYNHLEFSRDILEVSYKWPESYSDALFKVQRLKIN